jgi:hypothetical protein
VAIEALVGPRFKLLRAYGGLQELNNGLASFRDSGSYEFVRYADANTGDNILQLRIFREPPPILGIIIGEIVHNLRSALDQLACLVPLVPGAKRPQRASFPIFDRADPDPAKPKLSAFRRDYKGRIGNIVPEAYGIIESVQPYHSTGEAPWHPLALLEDLWNWDKHNAISVVAANFGVGNVPPKFPGGVLAPVGPVYDCEVLARWPKGGVTFASDNPEPYPDIHVTVEPAFGDSGPARGLSLTATLPRIHNYVSQVVMGPLERVIREAG